MLNNRIILERSPSSGTSPVLEMAMLGHCPGSINLDALTDRMRLLMRSNGYDSQIDCLEKSAFDRTKADHDYYPGINLDYLFSLFHLPIPISSCSEFAALFPQAEITDTLYQSRIAGKYAWLPLCVKDFFSSGGELLWLLRIPENEQQAGFLPFIKTGLHDSRGLKGLACLFPVNSVGLLAFPDLERLQLYSYLESDPRKNLKNPKPEFLPCTDLQDDDHRERRRSEELLSHPQPLKIQDIISPIIHHLEKYRPDLMCLYSPALEYDAVNNQPVLSTADSSAIDELKSQYPQSSYLRRIQFLHPYLQGADHPLKSASGFIGGLQCANAKENGIWRSIAGLPLNTNALPYPEISSTQISLYRQKHGLSILYDQGQYITLDDEQLTVPALHSGLNHPAKNLNKLNRLRSAEISRFMGFLLRELKRLGESLVFNSDPHDPAPRMLLEAYFKNLYQLGALRGISEQEAYRISHINSAKDPDSIQYDIQISPAYPVDSIKIIFNRINNNWQVNAHG